MVSAPVYHARRDFRLQVPNQQICLFNDSKEATPIPAHRVCAFIGIVITWLVAMHPMRVMARTPLWLSHFERNPFYVFAPIKAP